MAQVKYIMAAAAAAAVEPAAPPEDQDNGMSLVDGINIALLALPVAVRTVVRHVLGLSAPSQYVDLRSEVIVAVIRALTIPRQPPLSVPSLPSFFSPSSSSTTSSPLSSAQSISISDMQRLLNRDPGVRGPIWVSKYTAPGAGDASDASALRCALVDVVQRLHKEEGDGLKGVPLPPTIQWPDVIPVEAEWTGHRAGVGKDATLPPDTTEAERFAALMRDAPQPTTVLYLHGGAMYLLDPATHRKVTQALARRVHGRCYSVRYRLAPAAAFPAQILDALVSYLTLLYPPPGAFHETVSPAHIVFAGESAGGNLCLALTRVLLDFQRSGTRISWHGRLRLVPLPAGVAVNSPWIDISSSFHSWQPSPQSGRADFDYLPIQAVPGADALNRSPCAVWPASPPRRFLYTDTILIAHPLVTLLAGAIDGWRGAPPVYVCVGWEMLADEVCFFTAARLHKQAAAVVFEQYEAMPHCFALVLPRLAGARRCFDGWAAFIRRAVEEPATLRSASGTSFTHIQAKTLKETPVDPARLSSYTDEAVRTGVHARLAGLEGNKL